MTSASAQSQSVVQPRLLLLVKESGSESFAPDFCDRFDEVVVVAQLADETPVRFAQRVIERVAIIERSGESIASARLLLSESAGPAHHASRRLVSLGLATHAAVYRDLAELVLERPRATEPSAQADLLQLVEELLLTMPVGFSLPVRVRIGAGGWSPLAKAREALPHPGGVRYA